MTNDFPSGDNGQPTDRDTSGRFVRGNRAALVTGSRSAAFWQAAESAITEIAAAILADRGFSPQDAPVALRLAAQGAAQARMIRDSAFARMAEAGGPLSGSDRERGAHRIWAQASDRVLRHTQVIGFERAAPPAPTLHDWATGKGQP